MIISISGKIGSGKDTVADIINYLTTVDNPTYREFENRHINDSQDLINPKWQINRFADEIKDTVCRWIGCTREQLEDREFKETPLGEEWHVWQVIYAPSGAERIFSTEQERDDFFENKSFQKKEDCILTDYRLTPRKLMQLLGTEAGREIIHPDIWVNALFADYNKQYNSDDFNKIAIEEGLIDGKTEGNIHALRKLGLKDGNVNPQLPDKYKTRYPNWIIPDTRFPNEISRVDKYNGLKIRVDRNLKKRFPEIHMEYGYDGSDIDKHLMDYIKREYPDLHEKLTHASETSLDNYGDFHYTIDNNGTIKELVNSVKNIMKLEDL